MTDEKCKDKTKWSNKALEYAKKHFIQREVQIILTFCDKKGNYHADIRINNEDIGL